MCDRLLSKATGSSRAFAFVGGAAGPGPGTLFRDGSERCYQLSSRTELDDVVADDDVTSFSALVYL